MRRVFLAFALVFLLVVTFISCGGGGGGGGNTPINTTPSLTEGSFTYAGTLPAIDNVPFTNRAGDQFVSQGAYVGLVELFVDPKVNTGTVTAAIQQAGGNVVAQTPKIGLYVIQVGSGKENAFLNTMFNNSWVAEGGAVVQAVLGNATFDWDFGSTSSCLKYHGSLVTDISNRRGGGFVMKPVSAFALVPQSLADLMLREFEAVPAGQRQVINMSIYRNSNAWDQYRFLRMFFEASEQLYLKDPDLANRNLISIIAGNSGEELDTQLAGLKTSFPNAFKRIVIVGAVDNSGTIVTRYNHLYENSTGNMVYARGVDVVGSTPDGSVPCSGTSYAGPEVASVLDYVWARDPSRTSEQVLSALRQALRNLNTSVIPQDANGLTTTAFLNQVLTILGVPVTPTTFTLTVSTSGTGSGTVSSSPLGPSYTSGTTVTLTATPATGSTFTGWSGACSGTGSCVVTMDAAKTVTATFTLAGPVIGLTGSWSGTHTYPAGSMLYPNIYQTRSLLWILTQTEDNNVTGTFERTITAMNGTDSPLCGTSSLPNCMPVGTKVSGILLGSLAENGTMLQIREFSADMMTSYKLYWLTIAPTNLSYSAQGGLESFSLTKQ